jgi:hypothetical protein
MRATFASGFVLLLLLPVNLSASPILRLIDTFSGSALGWTNGAPAADPVVVPTGGPSGIGDSYLQITGDGAGEGGRITAFNVSQWAGDYLAAGIAAIEMDLLNLGSVPLSIRVGLRRELGQGSPGFSGTSGFALAADGAWHRATFMLDAANLTRINSGTLGLDTLLSNVAELRILHSTSPSLTGTPLASSLGVDNVHGVAAVPEASSVALLTSALAAVLSCRRIGRRR